MNTYLVKVYYNKGKKLSKVECKEFVFRCKESEIHSFILQELRIIGATEHITDVMLFKKLEDVNVNYSDVSFI